MAHRFGGGSRCTVVHGGENHTPKLVAWVVLDAGYKVRWRRGDAVVYVFEGEQMHQHSDIGVVDTIPVPSVGWTDVAEVRHVAGCWLRHQRPKRGG